MRDGVKRWYSWGATLSPSIRRFLALLFLFVLSLVVVYPTLFENGFYQYCAVSFLSDFDFNLLNQFSNYTRLIVTKTFNFPDHHLPTTAAIYYPFVLIFRVFGVELRDSSLVVISTLVSAFFFLLLINKLIEFYRRVFPKAASSDLLLPSLSFFLIWSGSMVFLRISSGVTCIVAYVLTLAIERLFLAYRDGSLGWSDCLIIGFASVIKEEGVFLLPLICGLYFVKRVPAARKIILTIALSAFFTASYLNQIAQFGAYQLFSNPGVQFQRLTLPRNLFGVDGVLFSNPFHLFLVPLFLFVLYRDKSRNFPFFVLLALGLVMMVGAQGQIVSPIYPYTPERILSGLVALNFLAFVFLWTRFTSRARNSQRLRAGLLGALLIWGLYVKLTYFVKSQEPPYEWGKFYGLGEIFSYFTGPGIQQEVTAKLQILKEAASFGGLVAVVLVISLLTLLRSKRAEYFLSTLAVLFLAMSGLNFGRNNENGRNYLVNAGLINKVTFCEGKTCYVDLIDCIPILKHHCAILNDSSHCRWYKNYVCAIFPGDPVCGTPGEL